jgi:hypothetical protein
MWHGYLLPAVQICRTRGLRNVRCGVFATCGLLNERRDTDVSLLNVRYNGGNKTSNVLSMN